MRKLHSEIEIAASPQQVWDVITDFARYEDWNPFIVEAEGAPDLGARLRVALRPPGGAGATLRPKVTEVRPPAVLEWWGHVGVRGTFDGRHRFELHPSGHGTRLVQAETFTGLLVPLLARSISTHTRGGFDLMNEALKARVEQMATAAAGA